jgi:hypothetical protein
LFVKVFRSSAGPARAIAIASVAVVALLAAAFGVTLWQNSHAHAQARAERVARTEKFQASELVTTFWRERETANEYLVIHGAELRPELRGEAATFRALTAGIGIDVPRESQLIRQSRAANAAFIAEFERSRTARGSGRVAAAVERLNAAEEAVLGPLRSLQTLYTNEATAASHTANSAYQRALLASIVGAILAVGAGIAFAFYALRLIARVGERESRLAQLVSQIKSSIRVLAEVAQELRAAAQEAQATTAEQSAAVA